MRSGRMWILAAAVVLGLTSVAAVEAGSSEPAQTKQKPKIFTVVIDKVTFGDAPAGARVGDTIEWVNMDIFDHTTTSKVGGWDVVIPAGKKASVVMKKAGLFDYLCRYHPNMTGLIKAGK